MTNSWKLRNCFSPPIPEIFEAARLLMGAVDAHLNDKKELAAELIRAADMAEIGEWLDPIWLHKTDLVKPIKVENLPPVLPEDERHKPRMPGVSMKRALIARDGFHCRFCGMPLVRAEVRMEICRLYPQAARWTSTKAIDQHRGLQVMWLQYDHVLVHSRGGETTLENMVLTCAACNFGRDRYCLEEVAFSDPRTNVRLPTWTGRQAWSGLEEVLPEGKRYLQHSDSPLRPI